MTICWTVPVGNGAGGGRDPGSIPTGSTLCEHSQRCSASPFIEADSFVSVMPGPGGMIPLPKFAPAFGNDRFQGLEPYPSIAALVQFSVVKPCAPSGVR